MAQSPPGLPDGLFAWLVKSKATMLKYITRRLLLGVATLWAISILSFIIIQLPPGDFVDSYINDLLASGTSVSQAEIQSLRVLYGLDESLFAQYSKWILRCLRGDFGISMEWGRPVLEVIGDRIWLTVVISISALILTWAIALPIGIYSAMRQYSIGDYIFTFLGFIGLAIPNFLLAIVLMYLSFKYLGTDVGGLFSSQFEHAPWSFAKVVNLGEHMVLPAVVLATAGTAQLIRIMRANLLDELRMPYVVTAQAKGLTELNVVLKYPVRAALNPFASSIAYVFPEIVSGSVIVSLVLNLPTVGPLLLRSLIAQDMYLAGAIILLLGALTVIGTLISDLVLMWVDPRLRRGGA